MMSLKTLNELKDTKSALLGIGNKSAAEGEIFIDNAYFNMIKRVGGAKEEIRGLLGYYNKVMAMFKTTSLFSVGFHVRNFFGNTMNMYLRGIPMT